MNKTKRIMITTLLIAFFSIIYFNAAKAEAKKYTFSSSNVTQFKMNNGYLTIKMDSDGVLKSGPIKKKNIRLKVDTNCIWRESYFVRLDGSESSQMSSYSKVRKCVLSDRKSYVQYGYSTNYGLSSFKVQSGRIVSFTYSMVH